MGTAGVSVKMFQRDSFTNIDSGLLFKPQ